MWTTFNDGIQCYSMRFGKPYSDIEQGLTNFINQYKEDIRFYLIEERISSKSSSNKFIGVAPHCHAVMLVIRRKRATQTWRKALHKHVNKPVGLVGNGGYSMKEIKTEESFEKCLNYFHKQYLEGSQPISLDLAILKISHNFVCDHLARFENYWKIHIEIEVKIKEEKKAKKSLADKFLDQVRSNKKYQVQRIGKDGKLITEYNQLMSWHWSEELRKFVTNNDVKHLTYPSLYSKVLYVKAKLFPQQWEDGMTKFIERQELYE